jgi:hypothetical protein
MQNIGWRGGGGRCLCEGTAGQVNRLSEGHNTFTLQHVLFNTHTHTHLVNATLVCMNMLCLPEATPDSGVQCRPVCFCGLLVSKSCILHFQLNIAVRTGTAQSARRQGYDLH